MERIIYCACLMALGAVAAPVEQGNAPGYRGYKLLSVLASTPAQVQMLNEFADTDYELDFWTHPMIDRYADIMVPPNRFAGLVRLWTQAGLNVTVKQNDVQAMIEEVEAQNEAYKRLKTVTPFTNLNHNQYYTYSQIVTHLTTLAASYPNLVRFDPTGKTPNRVTTAGNNIIHVFELSAALDQNPVIMLEVNIHAREHVTAASTLYTIDWLLANYASNAEAKAILNNYHLVVIPVANPDGYIYSMSSSSYRLWRKNRKYISLFCTGVDLNRNFGEPNYSSSGTCTSETYPGNVANSELETQAIQSIFAAFKTKLVAYMPVHCYSQVLLTPYSSSSSGAGPCNAAHQLAAGRAMAEAIRAVDSRSFGVGSAASLIGYAAKGTSGDWAVHNKTGIISIAYELRPSSDTSNGFVLAASHIVGSGTELLRSLVALTTYITNNDSSC